MFRHEFINLAPLADDYSRIFLSALRIPGFEIFSVEEYRYVRRTTEMKYQKSLLVF